MKLKKKIGYIVLIFGIVLLVFGVVTLFNKNDDNTSPSKNDNQKYVKTRDLSKKTRVVFLLDDNFVNNDIYNDEYSRVYYNDEMKLTFSSKIYHSNSLEEYANIYEKEYKKYNGQGSQNVNVSDITCDYLCKKYQTIINDKIINTEVNIYIETSPTDIAVLSFNAKENDVDDNIVNEFISNIKIDHDATYSFGKVNDNTLRLNFDLCKSDNTILLELPSNDYEENNSFTVNANVETELFDKKNDSLISLKIKYRIEGDSIIDYFELSYKYDEKSNKKEKITINDKDFYKYEINNQIYYVYAIDNENALIINSSSNQIELKDFSIINS